ncbi:dihydrofolate reductase family protein [Stackebrandtia nassauensis]|uniref:Bifunctional deaminase-reductase domain protein n=1 Tax=Stackebrandtia nassauensis (strain DSM 44728 / CIP 108903 / NRRL B-16338 / NBRC 102104 / LLR-40K-21) TaxID=446470 RepID=D3Q7B2_STANL|nr:dihydrofolate reductase family protein [Stackebrandtia nassauensis]ADD42383.1 bifunctional deaminase-reductase domain protein [Stackebrandtia nassauensis DSM 44728]
MRELVYTGFMSLDGVVDSPGGGPGEEHRGGGWVVKDVEFLPEAFALKEEELADTTALLFGRRSYEAFAPVWRDSEDHAAYKDLPKYVLSTTLTEDALVDGWGPTTILRSDDELAELKRGDGGAIFIHGSAELARRLSEAGLIDRYNLLVFPVLLGAGKSLFSRADLDKRVLRLRESEAYPNGVLKVIYALSA